MKTDIEKQKLENKQFKSPPKQFKSPPTKEVIKKQNQNISQN